MHKKRKYTVFISSPKDKKNAVTRRNSISYRELPGYFVRKPFARASFRQAEIPFLLMVRIP